MTETKVYVIYALADPERPWEIHRCGLTANPVRRYNQHLKKSSEWLESVFYRHMLPVWKTLEVTEDKSYALELEARYQNGFREQNMPLETMLFSAALPRPLAESRRNARSRAHAPRHKIDEMDLDQLKADVLRLYEDGLPRGAITRALHLGTVPFYAYIKQWLDEYDNFKEAK